MGLGDIAKYSIGSERLFTNETRSDWIKPRASLSELEIVFDCSNNVTAFLQGYLESF